MNKRELIERMEGLKNLFGNKPEYVETDTVIELISELDEPEKVTIPQFVADWIEEARETTYNIRGAIEMAPNGRVKDWLELKNVNIFAEAWVNGYEIQEKKYVVTDGKHLYFKNYREDIEIVILVDEQPGTMEYVKKFNTKEEAQKAADILGWKVQEVDD